MGVEHLGEYFLLDVCQNCIFTTISSSLPVLSLTVYDMETYWKNKSSSILETLRFYPMALPQHESCSHELLYSLAYNFLVVTMLVLNMNHEAKQPDHLPVAVWFEEFSLVRWCLLRWVKMFPTMERMDNNPHIIHLVIGLEILKPWLSIFVAFGKLPVFMPFQARPGQS
ncbi:uncharacterized protein LOC119362024 [Triticum dicoccoides]|uniref:uncharacterized protein LOC119362024 n=1 Tax=Triticum dicoccoides TaxID=85692 RepID=UPI00188E5630|nr:uncharacterized protein LOC119362024 [Triticum dicoccoides]